MIQITKETIDRQDKIKYTIKEQMKEKNISFYRLAKLSNIPQHSLSNYLNTGRTITDVSLIKILNALNIDEFSI